MLKSMAARTKSAVWLMLLVHIGLYRAEINMPTTAALMPVSAPFMFGLLRSIFQNGRLPSMSRNAGRKIANTANNPPCHPLIMVPR